MTLKLKRKKVTTSDAATAARARRHARRGPDGSGRNGAQHGAGDDRLPGEAAAFRVEQDGMIDPSELDLLCSEACWVLKKVMPDGRRVIAEANVGIDTVRRALTMGDFLIVREAPKA